MDIAAHQLSNVLRVKPGDDLEDIYDGTFRFVLKDLYYRSRKTQCFLSKKHRLSSFHPVTRTYNIVSQGIYHVASYYLKFEFGFYCSRTKVILSRYHSPILFPLIIYFPLHVIRLFCLSSERPHGLHVLSHAPKNITFLLITPQIITRFHPVTASGLDPSLHLQCAKLAHVCACVTGLQHSTLYRFGDLPWRILQNSS